MFGSLVAKETFKAFNASVFYKASADLKCAATYTHGGKDNGKYTLGLNYKGMAKAKINQDQTASISVKHSISKGFTLTGGGSYNIKKGETNCGLQLSIE